MILVTGATGRLGRRVVQLLRRAKLEVRCLVRPGSEYYWLNATGADYFFGDLRDPVSLRRATRGARFVIHAADIQLESKDNHVALTLLEGGKALIDAAAERGVQRFVLLSCVGAEGSVPHPSYDALGKLEAHLQASGLPHAILRFPAYTEDLAEVARQLRAGQAPRVFGHGGAVLRPISRQDAALLAVAALDHARLADRAVNLHGPEALKVQEALERACRLAEVSPDYQLLDGAQGRLLARAAGLVGRRWRNAAERQALLLGGLPSEDTRALTDALGIPLTPFDEAVRAALSEEHPEEDQESRNEHVVHRQFQATVYEAGRVRWEELPAGPRRLDD
ncbi:MAG: NAD(P)H-binding protein [Alphaproteobacteria bacterium]|nr:NAD(P)H-binding protein [Alphaproteobacteria bacterium]MCB9791621.1 NAD(P)H-binding protein [Alphaproteobacteria bacterium]